MRNWAIILSLLILLAVVPVIQARQPTNLIVTGAWARATVSAEMDEQAHGTDHDMNHGDMDMGAVSAAYMTITNPLDHAVRLVAGMSDVAGTVEIHETRVENDVARMMPLMDGLLIEAGETAVLEPGGYHVMMLDLTQELVPGGGMVLILTFDVLDDDGEPTGDSFGQILGLPVREDPPAESAFAVVAPWVRPTATESDDTMEHDAMEHGSMDHDEMEHDGMGGVTGAFMHIINQSDSADRLIAAESHVAGTVEIHETRVEDDVARMAPVVDGLVLPAGETVTLQPGGYHIMLIDLHHDVMMGDAVMIDLIFESGETLPLVVPVYDPMMMMLEP